jgi:membrane-bound lytic murein transglycosylase D
MRYYIILIFSIFLIKPVKGDIIDDFPSYNYVFNELDIREDYIYNPDFQEFVYKNKKKYTKFFIRAMNRGRLIIPTMRELMYRKDLSPIFIYLAMVESGFRTQAVSTSSAGGLWQFVKATAVDENLRVDEIIDERYDPIKATNVAIDYLYKIHSRLGKWYLTAMAYNCGAGCIERSIEKAGTTDLATLIDPRAGYIREETRKYIKKILLFAMIGENYLFKRDDNLGVMKYKYDNDLLVPVKVRGGEYLRNIASILEMDFYILKQMNLHLKKDFIPLNSDVNVNIPASRLQMFYNRYYHKSLLKEALNRY